MKKELVLIGAGGHCHSVIDVVELESKYEIKGLLDIHYEEGQSLAGYPVLGNDELIEELARKGCHFLITIGQIRNCEPRVRCFEFLKELKAPIATVVSPLAHVSKHAKLGEGTVVMHQALVNAGAVLGENCIINTRALIEHDCSIGKHTHVATGAIVNGGVKVGEESFIGSGSIIRQTLELPNQSFIKALSLSK